MSRTTLTLAMIVMGSQGRGFIAEVSSTASAIRSFAARPCQYYSYQPCASQGMRRRPCQITIIFAKIARNCSRSGCRLRSTPPDERCSGCGMCNRVCPHAVFAVLDHKAHIQDRDVRMECGACAKNCPSGAIAVTSGVGCVTAILCGAIRGTEPDCDCSGNSPCCG